MNSLFLLRHGQTEWNLEKRFQGSKNSPLTALGRQQARTHGLLLRNEGVSHIMASTAGRVCETVEIIQEVWVGSVVFDDRLVELSAGVWEGLTIAEVADKHPELFESRDRWPFAFKPPGGESNRGLSTRLRPVIKAIKTKSHDLAIVTHGAVLRMFIELLLDLPYQDKSSFPIYNETVFRLDNPFGDLLCFHYLDGTHPINGLPTPC